MLQPTRLIALAAVLCAAALLVLPAPEGIAPPVMGAAGLTLFTVALWATGVFPNHVTSVFFFAIAVLVPVAAPGVIFAGFESTAFWLVFGGLLVGVAVQRTGLGDRLARTVVALSGTDYRRVILGIVVGSVVLGFLMPSTMGRIVLLTPIVVALAERLGFGPGSNGRNGMVLAVGLGSFMPSAAILPANLANVLLLGTAETVHGVTIRYFEYLLLHMPVIGLLKAVAIVWLLLRIFPDETRSAEALPERKPLSREERLLAVILALALVAWATDAIHHVSPAWVALAAGAVILWPGFNLMPGKAFDQGMHLSTLVYVGAILGIAAVVAQSGLGDLMADALVGAGWLAPDQPARNFAALYAIATLLGMGTTIGGVPAIMTPLADDIAAVTGLPLMTVLMTQVLGFSTIVLPYQLPPLFVGMQLGGVGMREGARITLPLAAVTVLVLIPLDFFWWRLLGYL